MTSKDEFSKTMRIDLIPDVPAQPAAGKRDRVVITTQEPAGDRPPDAAAVDVRGRTPYQELLQSIYDAVLVADTDGQIVDANARAVEFLQYTSKELRRLALPDVVSGSDQSLIRTLWENLENERFTLIQAYCVRQDGSYFPAEIAVNKLRLGDLHLCFFIRDITLRRQAEEMLRTEHNAIMNAGNGIAVADLDGKMEYVNPAGAAMWGYDDPEVLLGRSALELFRHEEDAQRMLESVRSETHNWTDEVEGARADGSVFDVQISATLNRNSDGEPVGMVFSFVDTSDRKRAERAVRETERQRVMLESLGAACHHLSQPATILMANLGIIRNKLGEGNGREKGEVGELVDGCIGASETLGEILHRLIAVNEYKTVQYLDPHDDGEEADDSRIIEI